MNLKINGRRLAAIILLGSVLFTACTQSVSQAPSAAATLISTGIFVSPFPSSENPMDLIKQFAQQTADAQTAVANGQTPATPQPANVTGTIITPQTGVTQTPGPGTPTNAIGVTQAFVVTAIPAATNTPIIATLGGPTPTQGPRPTSYTLQPGEFPYCIARRFNVNPDELLSANGLTNGQLYYPNLTLTIPQTSDPFPADRSLHNHPDTYTVPSSDQTIYGVACYYGDIDPAAIAAANGLSLSANLTAGQQLRIP
ncbi:MAG TPA: LysM peptidoglycan-binding domain-containing protein [Anaerolineales bacterium]|nr:LysM peptidoglycan-binding domain-containing protein [Anaerolineales bacterium]